MRKLSYSIFLGAIVLLCIGLVILMSASSIYSIHLRENLFGIFLGQLIKGVIGVLLMFIFFAIPYHAYKKISKVSLIFIVIILITTLAFMPPVNLVRRWFTIGPFSFQPAELAKLLLIIHLAKLLEDKSELLDDLKNGFIYPMFWIFLVAGLIILQPSVSNALILLTVSFLMLFVAGANWKHLFYSIVSGGIPALGLMMLFTHSRNRIIGFISSLRTGGHMNTQVQQAMIGLGSGGWFGLGFGNSRQRNLHLPEAYGDFIFSITGEETGLIGAILTLALFVTIFFIGLIIAKNAKDKFGQLLGFGIAISFLLHALIHILVSSGLMPTTGIPLPFISHGGSSLWIICISLGILMNIGISDEKLKEEIKGATAS